MARSVLHTSSAWLLLWAYLASIIATPLGVLMCRDASGSSHIEWTAVLCCASEPVDVATQGQSAAETPCGEQDCDSGACVDRPISQDWLAVSQHGPRFEVGVLAPTACVAELNTDNWPSDWIARSVPEATGPPRQVAQSLAVTVLIL